MPVFLTCLMAAMAALLAVAVCAVLWLPKGKRPDDAPDRAARPTATMPSIEAHVPEIPVYAPPEGALLTAQLEVGQTFHVQTKTAKYTLTLRDPVVGLYDALRVGPKCGKVVEERFHMLFKGTFVPGDGIRFGAFVLGGNLCYSKIRGEEILDVGPSSPVLRVLFCIPASYQQAS